MNIVTLRAFRATDIEFINHHDSGVRIEFENTYSYNVKYTPDNNCIGEFTLEVKDKSAPDKFRIKAVIVGSFGYDPSVKKKRYISRASRSFSRMRGRWCRRLPSMRVCPR